MDHTTKLAAGSRATPPLVQTGARLYLKLTVKDLKEWVGFGWTVVRAEVRPRAKFAVNNAKFRKGLSMGW